jgi:hypothetical protein
MQMTRESYLKGAEQNRTLRADVTKTGIGGGNLVKVKGRRAIREAEKTLWKDLYYYLYEMEMR